MILPYLFLAFVIASLIAIYVWILLDPKSFFKPNKPNAKAKTKVKKKRKKRKTRIRL